MDLLTWCEAIVGLLAHRGAELDTMTGRSYCRWSTCWVGIICGAEEEKELDLGKEGDGDT